MTNYEQPWSVPIRVEDVPELGRHLELAADEATRARLAGAAGVNGVTRLDASFEVTRHGAAGLHVVGEISATVRQTCVVTLEPVLNEVTERVDLVFSPASPDPGRAAEPVLDAPDAPEPMVGGTVDLGAIATEFLVLGIDPYPRKPGAAFELPQHSDVAGSAFAALSGWKKKDGNPER